MNENTKLYTWKQWAMLVPAGMLGAALFLYRQYTKNGNIGMPDWIIACITIVVVVVIIGVISWWGNKPEK
jgi:peptidoglycan biosynthesis protein MviN/MurJ (putative lipid II flippase)